MFLDTFTEGDAKALCAWRYFPPDHEYDMPDWDTICREQWALADPTRRAAEFHALREDSGALAGFFRLVPAADAVTLGMGLRPDLCGKGLGAQLVAEACACCARLYPSLSLRLEVRAWNQRAIRCYQAAGFREYATLSRTTPAGQPKAWTRCSPSSPGESTREKSGRSGSGWFASSPRRAIVQKRNGPAFCGEPMW